MSVLTYSEHAHESRHRQYREMGVSVVYSEGMHTAYFTSDPDGICAVAKDEEDAVGLLMDAAADEYQREQIETARSLEGERA